MVLSDEILEVLCCPRCKGDLEYKKEKNILICKSCKLAYKIEDDIPVMLVEEAIPLEETCKNESD